MGVSEDTFLRIGVKSGGCSGNTYDAVLDNNMSEEMRSIFLKEILG